MKKTQEIPAKRKTLTPTTIPQKTSGNKPIIKESANNTLTKKLSLALEEKLNFDDKTSDYALDDVKNEGREDQRKLSVLEKAKALVIYYKKYILKLENNQNRLKNQKL